MPPENLVKKMDLPFARRDYRLDNIVRLLVDVNPVLQEAPQRIVWIWLAGKLPNISIIFQIDGCPESLNLLPCLVTHLLYLYQEFLYLVALQAT